MSWHVHIYFVNTPPPFAAFYRPENRVRGADVTHATQPNQASHVALLALNALSKTTCLLPTTQYLVGCLQKLPGDSSLKEKMWGSSSVSHATQTRGFPISYNLIHNSYLYMRMALECPVITR